MKKVFLSLVLVLTATICFGSNTVYYNNYRLVNFKDEKFKNSKYKAFNPRNSTNPPIVIENKKSYCFQRIQDPGGFVDPCFYFVSLDGSNWTELSLSDYLYLIENSSAEE